MTTERVWADGYGNWYARVPKGYGASIRALANIVEMLGERYQGLDLSRLSVRAVEEDEETITYVEAWTAVQHTFSPEDMDYVTMEKIVAGRGTSYTRTVLADMAMALRNGQPVRVIIGEKP